LALAWSEQALEIACLLVVPAAAGGGFCAKAAPAPIASEKTIAAMTVDFVIIRFLPPCEIRAGVVFIMVVLDWRHASSTFARNETQRRLERYLFQRPRPERCAPIPQNTPSRSKEPQAEATTCNPEHRLRGVSFWGGIRPIRDRDHFHKVELAF
jgi:hypothetical protein